MGRFCHQEPPGRERPEPGAGGQPGASRPCRLLRTQRVGLSGGGARWKPAPQTCQKRLLKKLKEPSQRQLSFLLQAPWNVCFGGRKVFVCAVICTWTWTLDAGWAVQHQSGKMDGQKSFLFSYFSCYWCVITVPSKTCIHDHMKFKVMWVYERTAGVLPVNKQGLWHAWEQSCLGDGCWPSLTSKSTSIWVFHFSLTVLPLAGVEV